VAVEEEIEAILNSSPPRGQFNTDMLILIRAKTQKSNNYIIVTLSPARLWLKSFAA
jgi:hypothetical protein